MNPRPMSVLTLLIVLAALTGSCWCQLSLQRGSAGSGKSSKLPGIDICGKSPSLLGDKIINGRPAKLGAYPWMANIGYRSPGSTVTLWACAGSLITDLYVITAAHCIHPNLIQGLSVYTVRLGELNLDESVDDGASPVDVGIENTVMHPEFDNTKKINDIALVKLERRIAFTDLISPICLPPPEFMTNLFVGFSPIIAGWGKSTNKTVAPRDPRLLEAEIEIFETEACRRNVTSVLRRVIIDDKVICAASVDNDSCQGDSGGPLMFPRKTREAPTSSPGNMFLMGVVSYGWYCAVPGYPGVYTRVSKHMSWIVDNLDI